MHERDKFAIRHGANTDALLRERAMAHVLKHHVAGYHQLDWAIEVARRGGSNQAVCPGPQLASESGAEKAGDHADILRWHSEHLGHYVAMIHHRLRGLVKGEVLSVPGG